MDPLKIKMFVQEAERLLFTGHIVPFRDTDRKVIRISDWYALSCLEHAFDAVLFAELYPDQKQISVDTMLNYLDNQREDGKLPCAMSNDENINFYRNIHECVSFGSLCWDVYGITGDEAFLKKAYDGVAKWDAYLRANRMTRREGLVEMFCGFDTGHDQSARLDGMAWPEGYLIDGKYAEAECRPQDDEVSPIIAVDMSANLFGNDIALSKMAEALGNTKEAKIWREKADMIKKRLFELCYDAEDDFFYDVDRNGNKRKYKSCTIFHLFFEGVLDPKEDADLIQRMFERHIHNPHEFWMNYPFPSMAANDPGFQKRSGMNCWGYFTSGITEIRCIRWMDQYGWSAEFDELCRRFLDGWTKNYDHFKFGQELDPITGENSIASEDYSPTVLMYIYATRRLKMI